ncbi:LysR family transcriptional regulator [Streptomonospora nanhaiensis]|uniref:DNA-binding transcriptional LysR family regulator n=1 Tax=Streptomonospora nanhaiensis TaxID=1323731 RepID=A0A853BI91_9ACTN|nr:LysR family transcriptional regulator [Streptomonospora nanhaiensis]MBV2363174.1 LysR family transcriptional regulator [Streptomonospora nanhaiensis]MBX9387448.1 LysR family transcriptional regulator [Streptomonospora nanhaiensis]NYI94331.1 DNA-binding transcriptional LysR family regulator [Streptomonospora nanhaiensis]
MERHEIEAFLVLAEELHFRRTAERLGLAQGRVSQTIKKLEGRLGVQLFERTSRRVALTPAGARLRDDLAPAYAQIRRAVARAVAAGKGFTGELHVGFSSQWAGDLLYQAAEVFTRAHPECAVRVHEVPVTDPFAALRAGQVDLQLTEFPVVEPDLEAGPVVFSEPRALLVPHRHPFARRAWVCLEDLAHTPLVTLSGAAPDYWREYHYPSRTPQGRTVVHGTAAESWAEVLALVATGHGVSPAALRGAQYHSRPCLAFVPMRGAPPVEYGLVWPRRGRTARVRAFCDTVLERRAAQDGAPASATGAGAQARALSLSR